jgi:hypothetical protein
MEQYKVFRINSTIITIYESVKLLFVLSFISYLQNEGSLTLREIPFFTPLALFPLMALFIRIDINKYGVFTHLYVTGKCLGLVMQFIWLLMSKKYLFTADISNVMFFFCIIVIITDIVSLWIGLSLFKAVRKTLELTEKTDNDLTEEMK